MKTFDTATRSLADTVIDGDNDDGTVIFFLQTGSGDADYAFMPVFTDDDDDFVLTCLRFFHHSDGLIEDILDDILPFFIFRVEIAAFFSGNSFIIRQQKFDSVAGVCKATGSV